MKVAVYRKDSGEIRLVSNISADVKHPDEYIKLALNANFIQYADLPDYPADVKKGDGATEATDSGAFFKNVAMSIGKPEDMEAAVKFGKLFHEDENYLYYGCFGKIYVVDRKPKPKEGLVEKEATRCRVCPDAAFGIKYITYEFPICALDIKPPTYKIKG